ncbi:Nucleoside-triphosphate phosphatase [Chlorociboria aeruginascens]|nr:Nucleoside-triphosphate phosphatase [Chlorociboria aeruginascens]
MTDILKLQKSTLDTPRSPVSISTDSSRRSSTKPVHPEDNLEPPTPSPPPGRLTRKRAASIDTESANHPRIGDLALNSASPNGPPTSNSIREQVCLCQPDPKIPRPRNAFILYRQHYQAQVVAQHPGLANPDISKIIGEQWREQAPEVKSDWKRLAEEEKQRHQRQYPGYRYQPRRAGKPNGTRPVSSSSADDPIRCPKCSGRYISTPSTPLTPFTPAFGASPARNERHFSSFTPPSLPRMAEVENPKYSPQMQNKRVDTPRISPPHLQIQRRAPYLQGQPLHTHHERDEDMDLLSPSPDTKRRRFINDIPRGYPLSSPILHSGPQHFPRHRSGSMATGAYRSQQQLPGPGPLTRPGSMGPPPHSSPMIQQPRHQYPTRSNTFDESLRLPPLQTQLSNTNVITTQRTEVRGDPRESQARSVEAMIMTIPYVNKIKVLSKISAPLAPPSLSSPAREIRGAVIAIEGADINLLAEIGAFIDEHLRKEPSCAVKSWVTSARPPTQEAAPAQDTEMTEAGTLTPNFPSPEQTTPDPFVDYFGVISEWHSKSQEIIKYITTNTNPTSGYTPESAPESTTKQKILPVALLPRGFSLTTSDFFALRIPINDSYAPVDHWQWMATLWRGIVGPDLTVYVKRVDRDEVERLGAVEIRSDCSGIVVRVPEGTHLDEKTARRLGFEVLEFVRGIEAGFDRN